MFKRKTVRMSRMSSDDDAADPTAAQAVRGRMVAAGIASAYLCIGAVWITFSDEMGLLLFGSGEAVNRFQTYKGWFFVAATAAFMFLVLDRRHRAVGDFSGRPGAPLSLQLAGLVLATAAPMLILLAYNVRRETEVAVRDAHALVQDVAAQTAQEVRNRIEFDRRIMTSVLEDAPAKPDCADLTRSISRLEPHLLNAALFDGEQVLCKNNDAYVAPPGEMSNDLDVSAPFRYGAQPRWHVAITHVANDDPHSRRTAQIVVPSDVFTPILVSALPAGGATTLIHGSGVIVARWPDAGFTGAPLNDPNAFQKQKGGAVTVTMGRDGVERVYAVRPVPQTDLFVLAGVPADHVYGSARRMALHGAIAAAIVLLISGILVTILVRRIAFPLLALSDTAERVSRGDFTLRAPVAGPAEVAAVAQQFNRFVDALPRMQQEIAGQEAKHRQLLEKISANVPGMIFQLRVAPGGAVSLPYASRGIYSMFEASADEAGNDPQAILARIHASDREAVLSEIREQIEDPGHFRSAYRIVLSQAGLRHYLTRANAEQEADGSVVWYGATVDVTHLENARAELMQANSTLERRVAERTCELQLVNEALESFSFSAAHDLRAPVAALDGFSVALVEAVRSGNDQRAAHLAQRIKANAQKMDGLIDSLLALARVTKPLRESGIDTRALVEDIVRDLAVPGNVSIEIGQLPRIHGDPVLVRQLFYNLISNGVKFTSGQHAGRVSISSEIAQEVVFTVDDNGVGFDTADGHKLFTAFTRLHAGFEGHGLGLSIVRRIAERHGGRVWATGAPGVGASFHVAVPATRLLPASPGTPA